MPTQPKLIQPAYLLAGVLFTAIALVAIVALFMLKSAADVTTQQAYPGNADPTVDTMYVAETSQGTDIGPAGIGVGFTTNEGLPKNIFVGGTITDLNGCHNLMQATVTLYRSGLVDAQSCVADTNECYHTTLYPEDFVGCDTPEDTNVTFETSFSLPNYVDPTDAGSPYEAENWVAYVNVADNFEAQTSLTETYEVASLAAFSVPNAINYGTVALGGDSSEVQLTFSNTGNRDVDSDVYAVDDMVSNLTGFDNIAASAVHYSLTSGFTYGTGDTAVAKAPSTDLALALVQQTDDLTIPTTDTYWRLRLPATGVQGTYTNTVVFTAKAAVAAVPPGPLSIYGSIDLSLQNGVNVSYMDMDSNMAYVTADTNNSMKVIDMSNSADPSVLTTLNGTLSDTSAITSNGDYVILTNESASNNFQIVNVLTPATPTIESTITAINGGVVDVAVWGSTAYVVGGTNKFAIVDFTNPASPSVVVGSTMTIDYPVTGVEVISGTAYVYAMDSVSVPAHGYLYTIDVTTPGSPVVSDTLQTHTDAKILAAVAGETMYVIVAGNNSDLANSIEIVNVTNPADIYTAGNYSINNNTPQSLAVKGAYLYVSDKGEEVDSDNINVVNIATPASMTLAAQTRLGAYNAAGTVYNFGGASITNVYVAGQADGTYYVLLAPAGAPKGGGGAK